MKMTLVLMRMMMKTLTTSKLDLLSKRFLLPRLAWCVSIKTYFYFLISFPPQICMLYAEQTSIYYFKLIVLIQRWFGVCE